jgi:hypothetical protein
MTLYVNPQVTGNEGIGALQTVTHTADPAEFELDDINGEYFSGIEILQDIATGMTAEIDEFRVGQSDIDALGISIRNASRHWESFQ